MKKQIFTTLLMLLVVQSSFPAFSKTVQVKSANPKIEQIQLESVKKECIKSQPIKKIEPIKVEPVNTDLSRIEVKQLDSLKPKLNIKPVKKKDSKLKTSKVEPKKTSLKNEVVEEKSNSQPLVAGLTFDWISKSQLQRDENISQIQAVLLTENIIQKYPRNDFRDKYKDFLSDKDHVANYDEISKGKREDADKNYAGFFLKSGLLVAYGVQYKNDMKQIYYYDAMGKLRYIDFFSAAYPKFPYYSNQYNSNGTLIGTVYFNSSYDQYVFDNDKTFRGRWYKTKMYNNKAQVIMIRSNY